MRALGPTTTTLLLGLAQPPLPLRPVALPALRRCAYAPTCCDSAAAETAAAAEVDKELTGSVISYSDLAPEMQALVMDALKRRNRERLMADQDQYDGLQGMIDAYVELGKAKGWTPEEAESEVVRYLQRRALRAEGGLEGDGQDNASFALLALLGASVVYGLAVKQGLLPEAESTVALQNFQSPFF